MPEPWKDHKLIYTEVGLCKRMCHGYGYGSDVVVDCLLSLISKIDTNMTHYALWFDMPAANFPVFDQIKPFPCFKSNILAELQFSLLLVES